MSYESFFVTDSFYMQCIIDPPTRLKESVRVERDARE
jgi:hypothetical protein